jgi:glutamate/aspartate transport system substrate-binding protein
LRKRVGVRVRAATLLATIAALAFLAFPDGPARAEDLQGADKTAPSPLSDQDSPAILSGTLKKVRDTGVVTLGYRESSYPFSYVRPSPPPSGYSIDLCLGVVDEIKRELGDAPVAVSYRSVTSETRMDAMTSGKIDLECGSTTSNLERQKIVAFSPVIFVAGTKLLVKKDSRIGNYGDLSGKTLAVSSGTTNEKALRILNEKYKLGINIIVGKDHQECYDWLVAGKADAFATDDVLLYGFIAANSTRDSLAVVGDYITYEPYGLMYRKDDPQMAAAVQRAFETMAQTGQLVSTYHKWFLQPTATGEFLDIPLSLQLTESLRALGVDEF